MIKDVTSRPNCHAHKSTKPYSNVLSTITLAWDRHTISPSVSTSTAYTAHECW